jgi:hypothetical protein
MTGLNLVHATISWVLLTLLKASSHQPVAPPILVKTRIVTALLQVAHFLLFSTSIILNTDSMHRLMLLLSIPFCLILSYFFQDRVHPLSSFLSLGTFCLGCCFISIDGCDLSLRGIYCGLISSLVVVVLSLFTEEAMHQFGCDAVLFQESVAGFRLVFSVLIAAFLMAIEPMEPFEFQLDVWPLCLITASAALNLTASVSMTSVVASSSALNFLMLDQGSEVVTIFLGHTLSPTKFATVREQFLSFFGFSLAIPGHILFLMCGNLRQRRGTDIEPFQIPRSEDRAEGDGENDQI